MIVSELSYKTFFTRFISGKMSEAETASMTDFLKNDDEAAEILCELDIPEFVAVFCTDSILAEKPYVKRFDLVKPLYQKTIDCKNYISTVFHDNYATVLPLLNIKQLKDIRLQYESLEKLFSKLIKERDKQIKNSTKDKEKQQQDNSAASKNEPARTPSDINRQRVIELDNWIELMKCSWGTPREILPVIVEAEKSYNITKNEKLGALLRNSLLEQHFLASRKSLQNDSAIIDLERKIQELEANNRELNAYISRQQGQISNFQEMKAAAEVQIAEDDEKIQRLSDDNAELKANCSAYHSILLNLNSIIMNALKKPVSDLERIIFEIEDTKQSPREIAEWLKEPIIQLRENFKQIKLNSSGFDNLPAEYCIEISPIDESEDWTSRRPVSFSDERHTCKVIPGERVLLRTRGFVIKNNINQTSIIKAEVVPCSERAVKGDAPSKPKKIIRTAVAPIE